MKNLILGTLFCTVPLGTPHASSLHLQGDKLLQGTAMESAMRIAEAAGSEISLDLEIASAATIHAYRERILALLDKYTDILLVNREEAYALTHLPGEQAGQFLTYFCPLVVIKEQDQGCWVFSQNGTTHFSSLASASESIPFSLN